MLEIARRLCRTGSLIAICGHNRRLRAKLEALPRPRPLFVEGFTREVPRYMQLADYFIGKPGPGSISEAVAMRLPVIVERMPGPCRRSATTPRWVREQGVGHRVAEFPEHRAGRRRVLEPAAYARFRAATERLHNRAVFEIPDILESILAAAPRYH